MSSVFRRLSLACLLPLLAAGATASAFSAEDPPYASLDRSLTTVRGIGDEIEIVSTVDGPNGRQYLGLMTNGERVIYGGPVTQITGDWHFVHFFRDAEAAYLLVGRTVTKLPGDPLSGEPFRVFDVDPALLPDEVGRAKRGWRGIAVKRVDGTVEQIWAGMDGVIYLPGSDPGARAGKFLGRLPELNFPYVSLADFRAWHEPKPALADAEKILYHVYGMTPDPKVELVFDYLELRPGDAGYSAFATSRAKGKRNAANLYRLIGGDPRYFLSTVYHEFQKQKDRPAFDEKLMAKIQNEDRTLGPDRLVYVWTQDDHSRIPGGIRLFQGYESESFVTKDTRLPVERSHGHLDIRGKFPEGTKFFELNRLAVRKTLTTEVDTKRLLSVLVQYLEARRVVAGQVILHTDAFGLSLFGHLLGAEMLFGPEQTRDQSYVLAVSTEQLRARMVGHSPGGRPVRRLRLPNKWCDWVWQPAGLPK